MQEYGIEVIRCSTEALQVPDSTFEYGFAMEVIEHTESPLVALKELARVCTKGIFVSIPLWNNSHVVKKVNEKEVPTHHIFELFPQDFRHLASHAGLQIEAHRELTFFDSGWEAERLLRHHYGFDRPEIIRFYLKHRIC